MIDYETGEPTYCPYNQSGTVYSIVNADPKYTLREGVLAVPVIY